MQILSAILAAVLSTQPTQPALAQGQPATAAPPAAAVIDPCQSAIIAHVRSTGGTLRQALALHAGKGSPGIVAAYEGNVSIEAHMMKPGMVRVIPVSLELTMDASGRVLVMRETSGAAGRQTIETTIVRDGKVASQAAEGRPFVEAPKDTAALARADNALWLPASAIDAALQSLASCREGASIEHEGENWSPITFTDAAGRACSILLGADGRVGRFERLCAHQRLGDVCEWTQFGAWQTHNDAAIPGTIERFVVQSSVTLRYELSFRSVRSLEHPSDATLLPEARRADIPTWADEAPWGMGWVEVGKNLWAVEIAASDSRVLVAEGETELTLLGAPDGDQVCGALLREIASRYPAKPVTRVAFGHHHPASSGGLRVLAASGATIIAPAGLEPHVRALFARPTSLGEPAIAAPTEPKLEFFEGDATIPHGGGAIHLYNIAEKSAHAFQYVVFYFPEHGVVFEDDLGYFPSNGATRLGPRMMGMVDELAARKVTPTKLIQLWPVAGVLREVEWGVVLDLVKAEREMAQPDKPK